MDQIETHDIQGLIIKGYSSLPACNFLLLGIKDKDATKRWLQKLSAEITPGTEKPPAAARNIAFTFRGLQVLGLPPEILETFPIELEDGMTTSHKQLFLGDFGSSDPVNWQWGGQQNEEVHILLLIYAKNEKILNAIYGTHKEQFERSGLQEIKRLGTSILTKRKEHFGFHDGIAQPTIRGLTRTDKPENCLAAGEFILGYKNNYDQYPETPVVAGVAASGSKLSQARKAGIYDLGKNGSYLVFRQMEQDVELFWRYMKEVTSENGTANAAEMIKLAAKMVGRWPGGAPVCLSPDKDDENIKNEDNFAYRTGDSEGFKCPIASHVRRTNPRDAFDENRKLSIQIANKHRILRRGRSYGKPVCESLDPGDILESKNFEGERGLHFICFNTDISRQFEFIQNAWVNNPKLSNLYNERDPLIGNNRHPENPQQAGVFSIPANGLRKRYTDVPQFVTIRGGAYFFMPGLRALNYLSSI